MRALSPTAALVQQVDGFLAPEFVDSFVAVVELEGRRKIRLGDDPRLVVGAKLMLDDDNEVPVFGTDFDLANRDERDDSRVSVGLVGDNLRLDGVKLGATFCSTGELEVDEALVEQLATLESTTGLAEHRSDDSDEADFGSPEGNLRKIEPKAHCHVIHDSSL